MIDSHCHLNLEHFEDDAAFVGSSADDDRLTFQGRIEQLLHGNEEGVHVDMEIGAQFIIQCSVDRRLAFPLGFAMIARTWEASVHRRAVEIAEEKRRENRKKKSFARMRPWNQRRGRSKINRRLSPSSGRSTIG